MTASVVWEYIHPELLFGPAMGSVQRLPNSNTLINWGTQINNTHGAILTEVTSNNSVALEIVFAPSENIYSASKHAANWFAPIVGCLDDSACNFNPAANIEPDPLDTTLACYYPEDGYDCDGSCLEDDDLDTICNENDNCPNTSNVDQLDSDGNGVGDACEEISNSVLPINSIFEKPSIVGCFNSIGQFLKISERQNYPGIVICIYSDGSSQKTWNHIE